MGKVSQKLMNERQVVCDECQETFPISMTTVETVHYGLEETTTRAYCYKCCDKYEVYCENRKTN